MATIEIPVLTDYILIVDDEVSIAELLKRALISQGDVHVAYDGEEGLGCILKQDYDLIITDINMPIQDGIWFYTESIKKKPSLKGKFIFMAGAFSDEHLAYFKKHEIDHFLKPSSIMDVRIAAKKVLVLKKTSE